MNASRPEQLVLDLPSRAAMGRADFFVAPCNEEAVAWIDRWPDWPAPCLLLHGPGGSGKTHLAHVWQARSGAKWGNTDRDGGLLDHLNDGGAACFDINGVILDEEFLFHAYNAAHDGGGTVFLTGLMPASAWSLGLADLKSRLQAAPHAPLWPPDDSLLAVVLVKLFTDRQLEVEPNVLNYLVPRMERSFAAAGKLVARLDKAALSVGRRITVPLARQVMRSEHNDEGV